MRAFVLALPLPALALAAAPASAAEPLTVSLGGYFIVGAGYADVADDPGEDESFGIFREGEIHFKIRGSSDNGLTFGGKVELEAFTTGDQIDETSVFVSGAFGTLAVGQQDTALNEVGGVGVVYPAGSYLNYYDSTGDVLPGHPGGFLGE
ncbi:MAG: porin, partial [Pseudomonadota bacterium]